ncbi:MAG: sugar phosphate isomerase/epimerase [Acidobacteriota bacterium]|nr:sugar phosphate isomerase/epimerase [Acidobacteriota bacterium]
MKIALCNEVLRDLPFPAQCQRAAALGYSGLELAPFTLGEEPHRLSADRRAELRRAASDAGIAITGLHWLLLTPPGLSITAADPGVRRTTIEVLKRLVDLCADLCGKVLVHGSPKQRQVKADEDPLEAWQRARDLWATVADRAAQAGVRYCIEPLAAHDTNFINTIGTAVEMMEAVANPSLGTMLDTRAASHSESAPLPQLVDRWLPSGAIAHVHLNDPNGRAPGQGSLNFGPVLQALRRHRYEGPVSVEPFDYRPDGSTAAARAIGYLQGVLEGLESPAS